MSFGDGKVVAEEWAPDVGMTIHRKRGNQPCKAGNCMKIRLIESPAYRIRGRARAVCTYSETMKRVMFEGL
jgi:hypothetical protein